jgi:hypothetical protein
MSTKEFVPVGMVQAGATSTKTMTVRHTISLDMKFSRDFRDGLTADDIVSE